mmetsp:Transcript_17983/g.38376  ORF Transcript_17983/g.38376 Transcript_17983/m.38376 type:complete len:216 (-) Transcript_17983:288-935(-)
MVQYFKYVEASACAPLLYYRSMRPMVGPPLLLGRDFHRFSQQAVHDCLAELLPLLHTCARCPDALAHLPGASRPCRCLCRVGRMDLFCRGALQLYPFNCPRHGAGALQGLALPSAAHEVFVSSCGRWGPCWRVGGGLGETAYGGHRCRGQGRTEGTSRGSERHRGNPWAMGALPSEEPGIGLQPGVRAFLSGLGAPLAAWWHWRSAQSRCEHRGL